MRLVAGQAALICAYIPFVLFLHLLFCGSQAVLQHVDITDHTSLRLVSHSVCKRINQHIPYLTLRLSEQTSISQVQQWFQATQRLQHVSSLHIHINGEISAEMFELAIQLLSQRSSSIGELHLLESGVAHSAIITERASIPSLQPFQQLLGSLQTLVIQNISIKDLPSDLQNLAAAATTTAAATAATLATPAAQGGWKLQHLTLDVEWLHPWCSSGVQEPTPCLWSTFSTAMLNLIAAFPHLNQLTIRMPPIGLRMTEVIYYDDGSVAHSVDEVPEALRFMKKCSTVFSNMPWDWRVSAAAAAVSAVAALVNAAVQLNSLEVFKVTDVPDIWNAQEYHEVEGASYGLRMTTATALSLLKAGASTAARAAVADEFFSNADQLSSAAQAVEVLKTLDDAGCWLMQQHQKLKEASFDTAVTGWHMWWRWQQQQQQQQPSVECVSSSVCCNTTAVELYTVNLPLDVMHLYQSAVASLAAHVESGSCSSNDSSSICQWFSSLLTGQLSHYSFRPADEVLHHLSSCSLQVSGDEDQQVIVSFLSGCKSLELLSVSSRMRGARLTHRAVVVLNINCSQLVLLDGSPRPVVNRILAKL